MRAFAPIFAAFLATAIGPAMALPAAYLIIETATEAPRNAAEQALAGLGNCKGLVADAFGNHETVVWLVCDDLDYMNTALTHIAKKPGVKRVTVWEIGNNE